MTQPQPQQKPSSSSTQATPVGTPAKPLEKILGQVQRDLGDRVEIRPFEFESGELEEE